MTNSNGSAKFRADIVYENSTKVDKAFVHRSSDTLTRAYPTQRESMKSL